MIRLEARPGTASGITFTNSWGSWHYTTTQSTVSANLLERKLSEVAT